MELRDAPQPWLVALREVNALELHLSRETMAVFVTVFMVEEESSVFFIVAHSLRETTASSSRT